MRTVAIALALLLSLPAAAEADGGTPLAEFHLELVPAGTTLPAPAACMPPQEAQAFDRALRTAEGDRDGFREEIERGGGSTTRWALISLAIGFAAGGLAAAVGVCTAFGCGRKSP